MPWLPLVSSFQYESVCNLIPIAVDLAALGRKLVVCLVCGPGEVGGSARGRGYYIVGNVREFPFVIPRTASQPAGIVFGAHCNG